MARPARNPDLHGNAPRPSSTALLVIDVFMDFRFPGGQDLFAEAKGVSPNIARLCGRARKAGVPVIYINDNAGLWTSESGQVVTKALRSPRGKKFAAPLKPRAGDLFVLKAKQSGFHGTPLEIFLDYTKTKRLILSGLTADICVFFTAQDAYVRDYEILVATDCVACQTAQLKERSLDLMQSLFHAKLAKGEAIKFSSQR